MHLIVFGIDARNEKGFQIERSKKGGFDRCRSACRRLGHVRHWLIPIHSVLIDLPRFRKRVKSSWPRKLKMKGRRTRTALVNVTMTNRSSSNRDLQPPFFPCCCYVQHIMIMILTTLEAFSNSGSNECLDVRPNGQSAARSFGMNLRRTK
jgi:hypothetical protein